MLNELLNKLLNELMEEIVGLEWIFSGKVELFLYKLVKEFCMNGLFIKRILMKELVKRNLIVYEWLIE